MKTTASTKAHQPRAARRQSQETKILELIKDMPQTLRTLAMHTGLEKSTISARLSDLQARGVVIGFETMEQASMGLGRMLTVTVYDYEPDEHRQIDHAHARRRNLAIARIESSLKNDLEFLPQALVANMRAFLEAEKAAGQLHSDYHIDGTPHYTHFTCACCGETVAKKPICQNDNLFCCDNCFKNYQQPEAPRPPDKFKPL